MAIRGVRRVTVEEEVTIESLTKEVYHKEVGPRGLTQEPHINYLHTLTGTQC